jgi:LuxR family maltose regulon positive regulatory protein
VPCGLIVVDDAHRIQDPTVFAFLDHVIERLPAHWGIVIATRVDPPMALARLRARGELAEFRQEELRFTHDEVEALVDAAPARAPNADANQLLLRTQGWAAGLGLALNSRAQRGALTERHVYDCLAAEVLGDMPADLRRFLLRCSVLPELHAGRCAEVSGDPRAAQWLAEIEQRVCSCHAARRRRLAVLFLTTFSRLPDDPPREVTTDELPALLQRAAAGEPRLVRRVSFLCGPGPGRPPARVVNRPDGATGSAIGTLRCSSSSRPPNASRPISTCCAA